MQTARNREKKKRNKKERKKDSKKENMIARQVDCCNLAREACEEA